jgi:hypothetical protein
MDNAIARAILLPELEKFRGYSYADLSALIGGEAFRTEIAYDGAVYYAVIDFVWDNKPGGAVRVIGMIDDGGWRAFSPLSDSFIKAPDGSFVDED